MKLATERRRRVVAFLLALSAFVEVTLVGRLFVIEVLLAAVAIGYAIYGRIAKDLRVPLFLIALWFTSQLATDMVRATPPADTMRGLAAIAFAGLNLTGLWCLISRSAISIRSLTLGLAAGATIDTLLSPNAYAVGDPWKFGVGIYICIAIASLAPRSTIGGVVLLGMLGGLNFALGFRSLGGVFFVAAAFYGYVKLLGERQRWTRTSRSVKTLAATVVVILASFAAIYSYSHLARESYLGEVAAERYAQQSTGAFGLLVGGRPQVVAGVRAVWDSPIIGHGSWAEDPEYVEYLVSTMRQLGYEYHTRIGYERIPSHSHLIGAWVEAGLLGALFWIWVLGLLYRFLKYSPSTPSMVTPLPVAAASLLFWDVLFSPFGAEHRFFTPLLIVLVMSALSRRTRRQIEGDDMDAGDPSRTAKPGVSDQGAELVAVRSAWTATIIRRH